MANEEALMAFWSETRDRQVSVGDVARSTDGLLNAAVFLMLFAFALLSWVYVGELTPIANEPNASSTITEPVTSPSSPNASPIHPAPSPNPGP
jgi:hypothetical protein